MHSQEQRQKAVQLFIEGGKSKGAVARSLGYGSAWSVERWYEDYMSQGFLKESRTKWFKFTEAQKQSAVAHFLDTGQNFSATIRTLGYPSRALLTLWVDELAPGVRKRQKSKVKHVAIEKKIAAVADYCTTDKRAKDVALAHNIDRVTLYNWKQLLLGQEGDRLMTESIEEPFPDDIEALRAMKEELLKELLGLKIEIAVHTGAAELLKKEGGVELENLTNREKVTLIDALRRTLPLKDILEHLAMSKSSYFYQRNALKIPDKYAGLRVYVRQVFEENKSRYGYRRIHMLLSREGIKVSEKIIRTIMLEDGLHVIAKKSYKYSSYKGEITPEVDNVIKRDFHADAPNLKWLTDLTEFSISSGKVYLSPIIDCFDGLVVSWTIGTRPNAQLVNTMLDNALAQLGEGHRPLIHSDRGCHYRWPGWIERMENAGLARSMSKKGCSPDNSACEGFFGRLKNEMYHGRSWYGVSIEEFIEALNEYIHWYNTKRIKMSLGGLSPMEYRQSLSMAA